VADYTEIERQKIVVIAAEGRGNPLYNQKELERRKLTAQVDEEFADAVLLPENDPTVQAEQSRQQQIELMLIAGQGTDVAISPRDNHIIHLGVIIPAMEQAAQVAAQDPKGVAILGAMLKHAQGHLAGAEQSGAPKDQLAQAAGILNKLSSSMQQIQQLAQAQAQTEEAAAIASDHASVVPEGAALPAQPGAAPPV